MYLQQLIQDLGFVGCLIGEVGQQLPLVVSMYSVVVVLSLIEEMVVVVEIVVAAVMEWGNGQG